ncbi:MAG: IS200/IS605 family transposase [Bacteroidetes bacterium]|nr:IS200/IS605 family transposase [Bacteroidota bacterium]
MADTYSQIYIHIVIVVKYREALIKESWEEELYKYITGIVQKKDQKMLAINGVSDHLHIFIGMKPGCCISDLVREIKKSSNTFINERKLTVGNFGWQEGFGAFSYSRSEISRVIGYIHNQKVHHQRKGFEEEFKGFLKGFEVDYKEGYLFDWLDR